MIEGLDLDWPLVFVALGVVLVALEAVVGGFFLVWIAAGLFVGGLLGFVLDVDLLTGASVATFSGLAFLGLWFGLLRRRLPEKDAAEGINDRYAALVGEIGEVREPFVGGEGWVKIGDTSYPAFGDIVEAGNVKVTGYRDDRLNVSAI